MKVVTVECVHMRNEFGRRRYSSSICLKAKYFMQIDFTKTKWIVIFAL